MKWINKVYIFIFFVYLLNLSVLTSGDYRITSESFVIEYDAIDEKTAILVSKQLQQIMLAMEKAYGVESPQMTRIVLASSPEEFRQITGGHLPDWTGAVFQTNFNTVVLKSPRWSGSLFNLNESLIHELSHLYFSRKFEHQQVPLWFNEGLAVSLSGRKIGLSEAIVLSNALWARKLISLRAIDSLLYFPRQKAELAYIQCLSAVQFLKGLLGSGIGWEQFLNHVASEGWQAALQRDLNMDDIDLELKWYRHIQEKYKWIIVLNFENLIWIALIFVLLLSLYAIRYRNKKRLSQWELEESQYDTYDEFDAL